MARRWIVEIITPIAVPLVIRLCITAALVYASYHEAGPATAVLLGLCAMGFELHGLQHKLENLRRTLFEPISRINDAFKPKNS